MFKLIFGAIKLALLSVVILVAANTIEWRGQTLNDRVSDAIWGARDMANSLRGTVDQLGGAAREIGSELKIRSLGEKDQTRTGRSAPVRGESSRGERIRNKRKPTAASGEDMAAGHITESERQKLRALIRDLNRSHER